MINSFLHDNLVNPHLDQKCDSNVTFPLLHLLQGSLSCSLENDHGLQHLACCCTWCICYPFLSTFGALNTNVSGTLFCDCTWLRHAKVQGFFIHVDNQVIREVVPLSHTFYSVHQLLQFLLRVSGKLLLDGCVSRQRQEVVTHDLCSHPSDARKLYRVIWCNKSCSFAQEVVSPWLPKYTGPLLFHFCSIGQ